MRRPAVRRELLPALAAALLFLPAGHGRAAEPYRLRQEVVVPGPAAAFDYVRFWNGRLFVGHRPAGLEVYDTRAGFAQAKVAQTAGSNGATIMPELGLGVSSNGDGTLTLFGLNDLAVRATAKLGDELDNSQFDPVSKRLLVLNVVAKEGGGGNRALVVQVPSLEVVGPIDAGGAKLENPVADGEGGIFAAAQDRDQVLRLDLRSMAVTMRLPTPGCVEPTGLDYDRAERRLYVGCRGKFRDPSFVVLDASADGGRVLFRAPISPDNDAVVWDAARGLAFAAQGTGADLAVFERAGPDGYRLSQVLGTRPMAKTLAYDQGSGMLYSITAEASYDASRRNLSYIAPFYPNAYFPDTFRILVLGR